MRPLFDRYRDIIPDFPLFQKGLRRPFPMHFRVNRLRIESDDLIEILKEKGIRLRPMNDGSGNFFEASGLKSLGNLLEYFTGYIHPQALTSCLAPLALAPEPGSHVLDMCASPGGKTSQLAQIMNNRGLIVANELYLTRHIPLAHTLSRLGVMNAVFTAYQAQEFPLKQHFDYILADVPCSGEGRIRCFKKGTLDGALNGGRPVVRSRLLTLQKRIIIRGYDLLKERGEMLYSTCTYNPDENESVVDFLLKNRDAELLPIHMDYPSEPGLTKWGDKKYDGQLERAIRFYPHRVDSIGFFMARIVRRRG